MGNQTECAQFTVLLPQSVATDIRDLSAKMGVPSTRLIAELCSAGISEAQYEWRRLTLEKADEVTLSMRLPGEDAPLPHSNYVQPGKKTAQE